MPVPQMPIAQPAAAPAADGSGDKLERAIMSIAAVLTSGRVGVSGAPAQPPTPGQLEAQLQKESMNLLTGLVSESFKVAKARLSGLGAPAQMPEESQEPEAETPPKPEDSLPFSAIELESTWHDGRKVTYPVKKDTGEVDWLAVLFTNPFLAEKMADGVNNVMGAVSDAVKKVGVGGPHIVSRVPSAAQDANDTQSAPAGGGRTGFGSGWGEE